MACCCFLCFCNSIKLLVASTLMLFVCLFVIALNFHREIKVVQLYIIDYSIKNVQ